MKELKAPTVDDMEKLKTEVEFNPEEEKFWDDLIDRRDAVCAQKDYKAHIEFYQKELAAINGRFGSRIAVERRLKFAIGHSYEHLGTFTTEGKDPKERYPLFEKAVVWYNAADETVGVFTDYALRQVQSSWGAASYRSKAGLVDETTEWYARRGHEILGMLFGRNYAVLPGRMPEEVKKMADETIDGVVNACIIKKPDAGRN